MLTKNVIKNNFSKNARHYDEHSNVQLDSAVRLIGIIGGRGYRRILEIGCGTGAYTRLLRERYPDADITATDISEEMIERAVIKLAGKNIRFFTSDSGCPAARGEFDLITSNASLQWVRDIEGAFRSYDKMLPENGVLCFSMYGPGTFKELGEVLSSRFGESARISARNFCGRGRLVKIMTPLFSDIEMTEENFATEFDSFVDLLRDIKLSGTRGYGIKWAGYLGKRVMRDMEKEYFDKFGAITATHHVYFCKAVK